MAVMEYFHTRITHTRSHYYRLFSVSIKSKVSDFLLVLQDPYPNIYNIELLSRYYVLIGMALMKRIDCPYCEN